MNSFPGEIIRVTFPLEQDEDGYPPYSEEGILVRELSEVAGEVLSIPFFVVGVSRGDLITYSRGDGEEYIFDELVSARGHSTIRVILFEEGEEDRLVADLKRTGCEVERGGVPSMLAIDVPPAVGYSSVMEVVQLGAEQELWDYEESCIAIEHRS
ncbi:DUF4265 domain-containing protein [Streptomyces fenghuangensis]|uniref:DUF4265 domain-containing protein n=1 Tax=Streptomyces sp. ICN903 TaxID=2964654 RepID=UPI001EDACCF0|nr:DUF4265 domain-containing protein [Streptomyces sp. ICN903]MCG3039410.1 DUF4265 domain-containing protein [Streptomyces sp. ICN903]